MIYAKSEFATVVTKVKLGITRTNQPYTSFTIRETVKNTNPKKYVYVNCTVWGEHLNLKESYSKDAFVKQSVVIDSIDNFSFDYYNGNIMYRMSCHATAVESVIEEYAQEPKLQIDDDITIHNKPEDFISIDDNDTALPFDL